MSSVGGRLSAQPDEGVERTAPGAGAWLSYLPAGLLVALLLALPLVFSHPFVLQMCIVVLLYVYLTSCWNIVGGYAGQFSLGHPVFMGIGGYTSTLLFIQGGLTPWIGMFAGAAVAALFSVLIGYPSFRLRGPYFALATLGFLGIFRIWIQNTEGFWGIRFGAAAGISIPFHAASPHLYQFENKAVFYYLILALVGVITLVSYLVKSSRLGYYLHAIRDDQDAAESLGVDTTRMKLVALAISAFFTALAGTYYAQLFRFIDPQGLMSLDMAFQMVLLTVVGGRGTVAGPIVGALMLRPLTELTNVFLGGSRLAGLHLIVLGVVLIFVVVHRPKGILEPLAALYRRLMFGLVAGERRA